MSDSRKLRCYPTLESRCGQKDSDEYKARGFDASEPVYFIGGAIFGLSDILAAQVTDRPLRPKPCPVNLPGGDVHLLLVDVSELTPTKDSPWGEYPNCDIEGWMFEEGFNPATDEFRRIRMHACMSTPETVAYAELQYISPTPDYRKKSKITLIQDDVVRGEIADI